MRGFHTSGPCWLDVGEVFDRYPYFEHRDPDNLNPVWHNFLGLLRAIDGGNAGLNT